MSDMYFESPMAKFEDNQTWIHDALWGTPNTYALWLVNSSITSRIQVQLSSNFVGLSKYMSDMNSSHLRRKEHILKTHYLQDSAINFDLIQI